MGLLLKTVSRPSSCSTSHGPKFLKAQSESMFKAAFLNSDLAGLRQSKSHTRHFKNRTHSNGVF